MKTKKSLKIPKETIRIRKPKKDREHNGHKKKVKWTNNDLLQTTQKTKDRATRILLKTRGELKWSGRVKSTCSASDTRHVTLYYKPDDKS